jgi:hypothetical protein
MQKFVSVIAIITVLFSGCAAVCFFAMALLITALSSWALAVKKSEQEKQQLQRQKEKDLAKSRAKFQASVFRCSGHCNTCKCCNTRKRRDNVSTIASSTNQPGANTPVGPIPKTKIITPEPETNVSPVSPASVSQNPLKRAFNCSSSVERRKQKRKLRKVKTKLKDKHVFTASEVKCLSNRYVAPVLAIKKELKCFVKNTANISDSPVPHNRN